MATNALEYQDWTPLLPAKIGGLDKSGEPTGMNKEESGKALSALESSILIARETKSSSEF